jgi:hypothetical protein
VYWSGLELFCGGWLLTRESWAFGFGGKRRSETTVVPENAVSTVSYPTKHDQNPEKTMLAPGLVVNCR